MADILVVDDDVNLRVALQMALGQAGHQCRLAEDVASGWSEIQRQKPDLALLDLRLPDADGLELLARMRERHIEIPVIMMTAFGTVTTAVNAMKTGAAEFIEKPMSVREICLLVEQLLQQVHQQPAPAAMIGSPTAAGHIIGESPAMRSVIALADKIAALPPQPGIGLTSVLISGETGTGKEMVARYIHGRSAQPDGPFVHVNCSAIPETLFEAEHFGHEQGVFTDAKTRRQGLFEAAHGGTLFLDEISDLPLSMQAKLLIAIETGRFRRLGSNTEQQVELRVIAATNVALDARVAAGQFRPDLLHRLRMFHIELPPLRARGKDLLLLVDHFLNQFSRRLGKPAPVLMPEAKEALRNHSWPGNVRELAHTLLRVVVAHEGNQPIPPEALNLTPHQSPQGRAVGAGDVQFDFSQGGMTFTALERKLLEAALQHTDGNITEAARLVGMTRGTFRYRLEKLGLV